jgi:hypothetical protein
MANDITTHPRLWVLDTVGAVKAAGNTVYVRHVHFEPTTAADVLTISEYAADGSTAQNVIKLKTGASVADPVDREYNPPLVMNGLYLSAITHGTAYVTVDTVRSKITA